MAMALADALRICDQARLKGRQREIMLLEFQCDLTQSEIAERLGMPFNTVHTHHGRALRKIYLTQDKVQPQPSEVEREEPVHIWLPEDDEVASPTLRQHARFLLDVMGGPVKSDGRTPIVPAVGNRTTVKAKRLTVDDVERAVLVVAQARNERSVDNRAVIM